MGINANWQRVPALRRPGNVSILSDRAFCVLRRLCNSSGFTRYGINPKSAQFTREALRHACSTEPPNPPYFKVPTVCPNLRR